MNNKTSKEHKINLFQINVGNEKYGLLDANCGFQIIELEDKLRAEGKLKTQADVDEFWCNMRKPQVYRKYFLITARHTATRGVIQVLRNAFFWKFDTHPPPRNANNVEPYIFVGKLAPLHPPLPHPPILRYVTLECLLETELTVTRAVTALIVVTETATAMPFSANSNCHSQQ